MSRIDQLIDAVRTRFLLQRFVNYGAWTVFCAAGALVVLTISSRLFAMPLPPKLLLIAGAVVLALLVALILAAALSPSRAATATRMDEVLKLKERFSTALLSRGSSDPFAQAAVRDAEKTAESVSVKKRFPLVFPRPAFYAMGTVLLLVITDAYMPQWDLLGKEEQQRKSAAVERKQAAAEKALRDALAEVMAIPKVGAEEKGLQAARREIEALLNEEIKDPTQAIKTAQNALREADAAKQKIEDMQRYADAEVQKDAFKALANQNPSGMMADVQKSLGEGKFDDAAAKLKLAVNDFSNADAGKQEKMAGEMKSLAEQMKKIAEDPNIQDRIRKELEKQGATPDQARRMADEMSRAAAGDRDAQQRVRDMAENLARRTNGGVLPAPEQLAPLLQKMSQLQAQAATQQQAADLAQAANQLANAMSQQANANTQKQPGQQPKGSDGQQAQGGSQPKNSSGQPGGQQPGQDQSGQGLADAQQSMEAALAEMEAMRQAADAAQASSGNGEGEGGGEEGDGWGDGNTQGGEGQGQQGFGQGPSGPNMGGQGSGERPRGVPAPYTVKKEVSPGETDEKGKTIASWLVKADSVKGESKEQFKQIVMSAQRDQAEDVDQDRVPMRAQKAVRDYFNALEQEAK